MQTRKFTVHLNVLDDSPRNDFIFKVEAFSIHGAIHAAKERLCSEMEWKLSPGEIETLEVYAGHVELLWDRALNRPIEE